MSKTCNGCDGSVSNRFAKVFGNDEDEVYLCLSCVDGEDGGEGRSVLFHGGAAVEDLDRIEW